MSSRLAAPRGPPVRAVVRVSRIRRPLLSKILNISGKSPFYMRNPQYLQPYLPKTNALKIRFGAVHSAKTTIRTRSGTEFSKVVNNSGKGTLSPEIHTALIWQQIRPQFGPAHLAWPLRGCGVGCRVDFLELANADLGVNHRGVQPGVAQHRLDEPNVRAVFQHQRGHRVPKQMATALFADVGHAT